MVADRLWPMLAGLAALLAGALLLQAYAASRGNDAIVIAIHGEDVVDEEDAAAETAGAFDGAPVSDLHARARRAALRALLAEAIPLYEQALAADPASSALRAELGYWLVAAGDPQRALPHLESADAALGTAGTALRLGLARAKLGDRDGAERDVRRALALRPGYGAAQIALGNMLRRRGAHAEAIAILRTASGAGSNEDRARALAALGAAQLAAGRRPEAERSFDQAILYAPARAEIRLAIARAWLSSDAAGDASRSLQVLLRAAELAPDQAAVHAAIGRARERLGEPGLAHEAYDRALRLDPGLTFPRRRVLRLALAEQDYDRARYEADRLVAADPADPEYRFLVALVADREGRHDDARRAYRGAIAASKDGYPEAWLNLGLLEKDAGEPAAAEAAYRKALALRPEYPAAWYNLARLRESAGRPADAEAAYLEALRVDPRHASSWLALGQLRSEQGRWDDAAAALREALAVRPGYAAAALSLGVAQARAGRYEDAAATYRALLAQEPRQVSAWFDLALSLQALGRLADARDALARALAIDPSHLASRRALAEVDVAEGRLAEARRGYEEVLDLAPGDLAARVELAALAAREGDRGTCETRARELRREAPEDRRVQTLPERCAAGAPLPTRTTR
jgi:tetratricopeptide (TPR) repeat protein